MISLLFSEGDPMPFSTLHPLLQTNLQSLGYSTPTPIQTQAIPLIQRGRDVLGAAQTGTGKTAAFALPILQKLLGAEREEIPKVRALILVPTRELATQMTKAIREYALGSDLRILNVFGGVSIAKQTASLEHGVDILIATPGRLIELNKQGLIPLSKVQFLVLDEADTIMDMGFIREVEQIIDLLPPSRQTVLFSATMTGSVKRLSERILRKPQLVEVENLRAADATLRQIVHPVETERKSELLSYLIGSANYPQVLVFTRTKTTADEVSTYLRESGLECETIHGDKKHGARDRAMKGFRSGEIRILVATDIAARGLDIEGLPVVINYDIPHVASDYIHRIGRTGRAGNDGVAITLLSPAESLSWKKIVTMLGKQPEWIPVKGFEPPVVLEQKKTYGKSMSKGEKKEGPTPGAFGNKRKKAPAQPKFVGKRGPRVVREEEPKKPAPKKGKGRGR